jgi:membrane protein
MPRRLQPVVAWALSHWPGRIFLRTAASVARIELFDRSMTIAAQVFTSVVPLLILSAVFLRRQQGEQLADLLGMPQATRKVLNDAIAGSSINSFGVLSSLFVLISATSLARALARAYGVIWGVPPLRGGLSASWRWVVAVVVLTASVVVVRILLWLADHSLFPHLVTIVVTAATDIALAAFIPWILLARRLPIRRLLPGAAIFGLAMVMVRPAGTIYLPHALQVSAARYGTIGVAFTYIGWLYILSFCLLAAAVVGQAIVLDDGAAGRFMRGPEQAPSGSPASPVSGTDTASEPGPFLRQ